jgi:hypothetical protein
MATSFGARTECILNELALDTSTLCGVLDVNDPALGHWPRQDRSQSLAQRSRYPAPRTFSRACGNPTSRSSRRARVTYWSRVLSGCALIRPAGGHQFTAAHDIGAVPDQVGQEAELRRRQQNLPVPVADRMHGRIHPQSPLARFLRTITGSMPMSSGRRRGSGDPPPLNHPGHPGQQFSELKRFADVVVATDGEFGQDVVGVMAGGEKDHPRRAPAGAQRPTDVPPVCVRQADVEHHGVGFDVAGRHDRFATVNR